jgi:hypothetical protein
MVRLLETYEEARLLLEAKGWWRRDKPAEGRG